VRSLITFNFRNRCSQKSDEDRLWNMSGMFLSWSTKTEGGSGNGKAVEELGLAEQEQDSACF